MSVIPAIDIMNGRVVRLTQGRFDKEKIYDQDPVLTAQEFKADGARLIHMVDLDGAKTGIPKNLDTIKKVCLKVNIPVQMGGGIRSLETIEKVLDEGIFRVVLGTKAIEDIGFLKSALAKWKEKIVVSLDCVNGFIATEGWTKISKIKAVTIIPQLETMGLKTLVYTDIATDGMLQGPNINALSEIFEMTKMNVISSGGISKIEDIQSLCHVRTPNLVGIIVGKALYEKKFTLKEAIAICSKNA